MLGQRANPDDSKVRLDYCALILIKKFRDNSNFAVLPAVIALKGGSLKIPLLSGNETMNNNWINFMKSKASPELKKQRLDDLVEKVKTNLVLFSGSAIKAGDLPVVSREKFAEQLSKVNLECSLKAGNFFRAEIKKKFEDVFDLKVSLKGDSIGSRIWLRGIHF